MSRQCPVDTALYTIRPGDTLYLIAQEYNTTINAILRINPDIDPLNLQIGSEICVPVIRF